MNHLEFKLFMKENHNVLVTEFLYKGVTEVLFK